MQVGPAVLVPRSRSTRSASASSNGFFFRDTFLSPSRSLPRFPLFRTWLASRTGPSPAGVLLSLGLQLLPPSPLHSGKCLLAGFSVVVSPFCPTLLVVVGPSALSTVSDGIFARGVLSVYSISLGRRVLFYLLMCLVGSRYLDFYVLLGPASFVTSIFRF